MGYSNIFAEGPFFGNRFRTAKINSTLISSGFVPKNVDAVLKGLTHFRVAQATEKRPWTRIFFGATHLRVVQAAILPHEFEVAVEIAEAGVPSAFNLESRDRGRRTKQNVL